LGGLGGRFLFHGVVVGRIVQAKDGAGTGENQRVELVNELDFQRTLTGT
jgi:hypothetical protein